MPTADVSNFGEGTGTKLVELTSLGMPEVATAGFRDFSTDPIKMELLETGCDPIETDAPEEKVPQVDVGTRTGSTAKADSSCTTPVDVEAEGTACIFLST
mmetsp:Transcript_44922/g.71767  ORF Transcript_44922/g.71767 Transcript_44922/m.71767 type:complete len:100 (-) Transcript_44922:39-338(-)